MNTCLLLIYVSLISCMSLKISGRHQLVSTGDLGYNYEGCDPFEDEQIDNRLLRKIKDNIKRKEILNILLNDDYSIAHKMKVIEVYRYLIDVGERKQSIYVEDLLKDWDFDIK